MKVCSFGAWFALFLLILSFLACAPSSADPPRSPGAALVQGLTVKPLEFVIPRIGREVERIVLGNGMVAYLAEDRTRPLLNVFAGFRAGRVYRSDLRPGIGEATAYQIRSGGTTSLSHEKIAAELEQLGITVDVGTGMELLSFTVTALDRHADRALGLFADMLRNPLFDPRPLRAYKGQALEGLRRLSDSPAQLLPREMARLLYTEHHPAGRYASSGDIRAITREDLQSFSQRFFRPDNMWLLVVGNSSTGELRRKLQSLFEDWRPSGSPPVLDIPDISPRFAPEVYVLPRPVAQSNILLGHFGVSRGNPDRHAIEMMNLILGGNGFSSRLVDRLRTKEGVTYSVASSFPTTTPMRGIFRVSVQTANEKAPQAIAAVQEEMHRMQAELVPNNELEAAKDFLSNNFVFRFSSRFSTLLQLLSLETQGRAPDDLERLLDRYRRVTARDVQLAAQRYLRPDALTILMMGDSGGAENDLRRFGTVRRLSPIQNN